MRGTFLLIAGLLAPTAAYPAPSAKPPSPTKAAPTPPTPAAAAPTVAACTPPEPPPASARPMKPALPAKPACLDAKEGCPGWEAYSYNDAIKAYNLQAQAFRPIAEGYVQKLNAYVKASADYAQCEVNAMQQ
ncbi:hypothetical protein [Methylobacterium sp. P5_C11]